MADDIKTTRLELIETRSKIKLAEKGHNLLKQKRDVLVLEFFKIMKEAQDLRSSLNDQISKAFSSLAMAQAYHGIIEVENISMSTKKAPGVLVESKNVMGVQIPNITGEYVAKTIQERGYSLQGSSAKIDEASSSFEKSLEVIIKLAETENALKKLIKEIEKTKRRVNALDYVMIPNLKSTEKYIVLRLEEMEREQFISLKTIKAKLEQEHT
ncbi:MAG: V-type ATP synthase subunit D [Candidatus Diapherotrites archaeon]|uniref:A-type ATP synthase subunit D n=1 Tax=Candidatus Iainarchaeum sp. TaxID=3101447 RepID=A0A2D6LQB7_9ARCH|nr:V-type ATP synthase subunit D [Candidatus Diapherotrites archaeon]|tara:strand:+ start:19688 stop:20323 length:636 start_codon:yes stop_codon:yes gene_type:complete